MIFAYDRQGVIMTDIESHVEEVSLECIIDFFAKKNCTKMHKNRPQLLVAGPLILHDTARPHFADVVTKNFGIMVGKCYLMHITVQTLVHQISTYIQS